ncbi:MAG: nuclear transport factor 2 family protein [Gemmatimonadaceae bacterium]
MPLRTVTTGTLVLMLILALAPAPASAQGASPDTSRGGAQNREQEVLAVIKRLFDGLRAADSAAVRSVFDPDAKFVSVTMRGDSSRIQNEVLEEFLRAISSPRPQPLDERLRNTRVFVDGDLATVWTEYDFYVGDRFSHCGVDTFQLVRRPQGWKVIALADTRRRTGCGK